MLLVQIFRNKNFSRNKFDIHPSEIFSHAFDQLYSSVRIHTSFSSSCEIPTSDPKCWIPLNSNAALKESKLSIQDSSS